eukprot:TRINITY_DN12479_c1_g7_i2.p1 TRINITY_DN12479_c1_g7~~TRINITY_DN12479_c1_g7_i2.p1  ORF type:complete len:1221 (+),score=280.62 TRINITY_DN12479_c1_g7_i2:166-3828(+)
MMAETVDGHHLASDVALAAQHAEAADAASPNTVFPSIDHAKQQVGKQLDQRRTKEQLMQQNIYKDALSPNSQQEPHYEQASKALQRGLQRRRSVESLRESGIMRTPVNGKVAPSIAEKQYSIQRHQIQNTLENRLTERPGPLDLMQAKILCPNEPILSLLEPQPIHLTTSPPRHAPPAPPLPPTLGQSGTQPGLDSARKYSWQNQMYKTPSGELIPIKTPQHGSHSGAHVTRPQASRAAPADPSVGGCTSQAPSPLDQPSSVGSAGSDNMDTDNDSSRYEERLVKPPAHPHIISEALMLHVKDKFVGTSSNPSGNTSADRTRASAPAAPVSNNTTVSLDSESGERGSEMRTDADEDDASKPQRMSPIIEDVERAANIKLQVNQQLTAVQSKTCLPLKGVRDKVRLQQPQQQRLLVHQELADFHRAHPQTALQRQPSSLPATSRSTPTTTTSSNVSGSTEVTTRLKEHRKRPRRNRSKREFKFFEYNPTESSRSGKVRGRRPKDMMRSRSPSVARANSRGSSRGTSPSVRSTKSIAQQQQQYYLQLQDMYRNQSAVSPFGRLSSSFRGTGSSSLSRSVGPTTTTASVSGLPAQPAYPLNNFQRPHQQQVVGSNTTHYPPRAASAPQTYQPATPTLPKSTSSTAAPARYAPTYRPQSMSGTTAVKDLSPPDKWLRPLPDSSCKLKAPDTTTGQLPARSTTAKQQRVWVSAKPYRSQVTTSLHATHIERPVTTTNGYPGVYATNYQHSYARTMSTANGPMHLVNGYPTAATAQTPTTFQRATVNPNLGQQQTAGNPQAKAQPMANIAQSRGHVRSYSTSAADGKTYTQPAQHITTTFPPALAGGVASTAATSTATATTLFAQQSRKRSHQRSRSLYSPLMTPSDAFELDLPEPSASQAAANTTVAGQPEHYQSQATQLQVHQPLPLPGQPQAHPDTTMTTVLPTPSSTASTTMDDDIMQHLDQMDWSNLLDNAMTSPTSADVSGIDALLSDSAESLFTDPPLELSSPKFDLYGHHETNQNAVLQHQPQLLAQSVKPQMQQPQQNQQQPQQRQQQYQQNQQQHHQQQQQQSQFDNSDSSSLILVLERSGFVTDPDSSQMRPLYKRIASSFADIDGNNLDGLFVASSQPDGSWSSPRPLTVADLLQHQAPLPAPAANDSIKSGGSHQRASSWSGSCMQQDSPPLFPEIDGLGMGDDCLPHDMSMAFEDSALELDASLDLELFSIP